MKIKDMSDEQKRKVKKFECKHKHGCPDDCVMNTLKNFHRCASLFPESNPDFKIDMRKVR